MTAFNQRIRPPEILGMPAAFAKGAIVSIMCIAIAFSVGKIFGVGGLIVVIPSIIGAIVSAIYAIKGGKEHKNALLRRAIKQSKKEENAVTAESLQKL